MREDRCVVDHEVHGRDRQRSDWPHGRDRQHGDRQRSNRQRWNANGEQYQEAHSGQLAQAGMGWGPWSVPEEELGALGPVVGRHVLEIGCGAAHWSAALAGRGAHCVGLDLSEVQLTAAQSVVRGSGERVPLVQAGAEELPFLDGSFDLVFCDHGGASWAEPALVVAEAARVLRPAGRFVANVSSPWLQACVDPVTDLPGVALRHPYFDRPVIEQENGAVVYSLTYGEWVRTIRGAGLLVEDLIELRPTPDATTTYDWYAERDWARRWPAEALWVASKPAA